MKTIESIQIWDNGQIKTGSVLNASANVNLNKDAAFNYCIYSLNENQELNQVLASGVIYMDSEIYATWEQDEFAWDFVASALNLVITGDYVAPQPVQEIKPIIESAPILQENA